MDKWIEEQLDLEYRERIADMDCLRDCLVYFKWFAKKNNLNFEETRNIIDRFFINYLNLYQTNPEEVMLLLQQKKFKEKSALHEMLYVFLEDENNKWLEMAPFVNSIKKVNRQYNINTSLGTITLKKASDYFMMTPSRFIFKKTLTGMCFDRTTEFINKNPDYEAVVSYLPNVFVGGHYHAYAKKDDIIVDPACNAIFFDGTGEIVEKGNIIYQATAEELNKASDDYDYPKLLVAAIKHSKNK